MIELKKLEMNEFNKKKNYLIMKCFYKIKIFLQM